MGVLRVSRAEGAGVVVPEQKLRGYVACDVVLEGVTDDEVAVARNVPRCWRQRGHDGRHITLTVEPCGTCGGHEEHINDCAHANGVAGPEYWFAWDAPGPDILGTEPEATATEIYEQVLLADAEFVAAEIADSGDGADTVTISVTLFEALVAAARRVQEWGG